MSLIEGDYPKSDMEILILDGMSTDGTRKIIRDIQKQHSGIKLIDNTDQYQVYALNKGIQMATGDIIIRCDVHCVYPREFISEIVKYHYNKIGDNIGAVLDTHPGNDGKQAKSIAKVMSSRLGMGISHRTIRNQNSPIEVDTVPFGSWSKETLKEVGGFNEKFIRSQDLEHNVRMKKLGKKIILLPWVKIKYFARENYTKLWKMFYQYGYWKNMVNKEHNYLSSFRQLFPSLLVLSFVLSILLFALSTINPYFMVPLLSLSFVYLSFIIFASVFLCYPNALSMLFHCIAAFAVAHFSYGVGYLYGFLHFIILGKDSVPESKKTHTR